MKTTISFELDLPDTCAMDVPDLTRAIQADAQRTVDIIDRNFRASLFGDGSPAPSGLLSSARPAAHP